MMGWGAAAREGKGGYGGCPALARGVIVSRVTHGWGCWGWYGILDVIAGGNEGVEDLLVVVIVGIEGAVEPAEWFLWWWYRW